jgi:hypothetical protein
VLYKDLIIPQSLKQVDSLAEIEESSKPICLFMQACNNPAPEPQKPRSALEERRRDSSLLAADWVVISVGLAERRRREVWKYDRCRSHHEAGDGE